MSLKPVLVDARPMQAARLEAEGGISMALMPTPALPEGGALIGVLACGLCGSDLDKWANRKAAAGVILGHEVVGVIQALAENAPGGWAVGDRLVTAHHVPCGTCHYCANGSESMCRAFKRTNLDPGGFAQTVALSPDHLRKTALKVPEGVSTAAASCVEPLACVLHAVHRAGMPAQNGSVAIVGLGFIGLLAAQVYQQANQAVYGLDLDASRRAFAQNQGFVREAFHPTEEEKAWQAALQRVLPTGRVDTVFLTVVNPHTLSLALALVRDGGTLLAFASGPPGTVVDPGVFYFREINLITSYSPALADLQTAARLIFSRKIEVEALMTHRVPLVRIEEAFSLYQSGQALKVLVEIGERTVEDAGHDAFE